MAAISRLPRPLLSLYAWQFEAACADTESTLFFHVDGERGPALRNRDTAALAIHASCRVIRACREHALSAREPCGVWGGLTATQRQALYARQHVGSSRTGSDYTKECERDGRHRP